MNAAALCVLASGSQGNCSVLRVRLGGAVRTVLIDLGLSPRRTAGELATLGLSLADVDAVLLTHLDRDHCHAGWCGPPRLDPEDAPLLAPLLEAQEGGLGTGRSLLARHTEVFLPRSSLGRAYRAGLNAGRLHPFRPEEPFATRDGLRVKPLMVFHDALGTAAFRIEAPGSAGETGRPAFELGFATDLGRVTDELVEHLRGVGVLAIESNYCPRMQRASARPEYLKRRIMGGRGHLSNEEAAEAVRLIEPRSHVVFLHLSRQCNTPETVAALHEGADYGFTITSQEQASRWVPLGAGAESDAGTAAEAGAGAGAAGVFSGWGEGGSDEPGADGLAGAASGR